MSIHIYTAQSQPLTRYRYPGHRKWWGRKPSDTTWSCDTCDRRRAARNLRIQVYYDCIHISCREGHYQDRWGRWKTKPDQLSSEPR